MIREYLTHIRLFNRNIRAFLWANVFIGLGAASYSVLGNLLMADLGFPKSLIGYIQGASSAGTMIAALPIAMLYDRFDARGLLLVAAVVKVGALMAFGLGSDFRLLYLAAAIWGAGMAVHAVAAGPFIMKNSGPRERVYAFGLSFACEWLAGVLGSWIAGNVPEWIDPSSTLGIRWALMIGAGLVALSFIPYWMLTQEAKRVAAHGETVWKKLLQFRKDLAEVPLTLYMRIILPDAVIGVGAGITIPFLNLYLKDRFHFDSSEVGSMFSVVNAFVVVGMLAGPMLAKRYGLLQIVRATQVLSLPFMITLALTFHPSLAVTALLLRGMLMNMGHPLNRAFQMEVVPTKQQAVMNSLAMLGWNGSWIVGTALGGALIEAHGFTVSILCTAVIYILSTFLLWIFWSDPKYLKIGRVSQKDAAQAAAAVVAEGEMKP